MPPAEFKPVQNFRAVITALLIACFVFLAGIFWLHLHNESDRLRADLHLQAEAGYKAKMIEQRLARALMATRMLEVQLRLNKGSRENFAVYAQEILATTPGVSNIQLAPEGIITDIYPLAGNEKAIGHNILKDDRRRDEARKAVSTRKTTLAGPFKLIQGGVAVIGRQPVFVDNGDKEAFWGFASALVHLDSLLSTAQLQELELQGLAYELSYREIGTGKIKVIQKSELSLGPHWHQENVSVPNNTWIFKVGYPESSGAKTALAVTMVVLASAIAGILCLYLLRLPSQLYQEKQQLITQLREQSELDPLTHLDNRVSLISKLQSPDRQAERNGKTSAVLVFSLDEFKTLNTLLGHDRGDAFLIQVGKKLQAMTGTGDICARIGGDEFALYLSDIDSRESTNLIANKIMASVSGPIEGLAESFSVTASVGVSVITPDQSALCDAFYQADLAMQGAKQAGKNRTRFSLFS